MTAKKSFLGTGWSFPPVFDQKTHELLLVNDEQDIKESLQILLSTRQGERVLLPEYGCNLDQLLFAPLTLTLKTLVSELIKTAILFFEPRIDVEKIDISQDKSSESILLIRIDYLIRSTNSRTNLVYPFYLHEGLIK